MRATRARTKTIGRYHSRQTPLRLLMRKLCGFSIRRKEKRNESNLLTDYLLLIFPFAFPRPRAHLRLDFDFFVFTFCFSLRVFPSLVFGPIESAVEGGKPFRQHHQPKRCTLNNKSLLEYKWPFNCYTFAFFPGFWWRPIAVLIWFLFTLPLLIMLSGKLCYVRIPPQLQRCYEYLRPMESSRSIGSRVRKTYRTISLNCEKELNRIWASGLTINVPSDCWETETSESRESRE